MEPFKNEFSRAFVKDLANRLSELDKGFSESAFVKSTLDHQWKNLELKERMRKLSLSLGEHLSGSYGDQLKIILTVAPHYTGGIKGMVFPDFVEVYGLDKKNRIKSLNALEKLTPYFSSEFAIRPFLVDDLKGTLKYMMKWSKSKNEHVRRLASEGCRPRLPWGIALSELKKDPKPIFLILENLKNDPSEYVRRSVANNINDIVKDHPDWIFKKVKPWMGKSDNTDKLVKHGLRTLLKQGDQKSMRLFGYGSVKDISLKKFKFEKKSVAIGERFKFDFDIVIKKKSKIRLEYAVYFLLKNGEFGKKVFKISEKEVEKGILRMSREHNFKIITTRVFYPGTHQLSLIVNGHEFTPQRFTLKNESKQWWLYIIETKKGTFYTGVTTDLERRFKQHSQGKGAKFLRGKPLKGIIYREKFSNQSAALKREIKIKKMTKLQKRELLGI